MNTLPKLVLLALILEAYEFGDLEDTRENIEAPYTQLSEEGYFIVKELHRIGITTTDKVDKFFEVYIQPLLNLPQF